MPILTAWGVSDPTPAQTNLLAGTKGDGTAVYQTIAAVLDEAGLTPAYGELYVKGGVGSQSVGETYVKITQFTNSGSSAGMTADHTTDSITVAEAAVCFVAATMSFSGTGGTLFELGLFLDGVEQDNLGYKRELGVGGDVGAGSISGVLSVPAGGVIDLRVFADGASDDFDLIRGNLSVISITGAPAYTSEPVPTEQTGTTHTPDIDDAATPIRYTNAAQVTVSIPLNSAVAYAAGTTLVLLAEGAGGVTVDDAAVTVVGTPNKTIAQGEVITLYKAVSPDTWFIIGGTAA